jgi:hypothetical protein
MIIHVKYMTYFVIMRHSVFI